MRNKSKKLIAIMAALMIAGSSVAATATTAFAAVEVAPGETSSYEKSAVGTDTDNTATSYTVTVASNELYYCDDETAAEPSYSAFALAGDYNFGDEVNPFAGKNVYVKVTVSGDSSTADYYVKATDVVLSNNINYTTDKAVAKVFFTDTTDTKVNNKKVTASVDGYVIVNFAVNKYDLNNTIIQKQVETTWTGKTISVNKADLQLYRKDANNDLIAVDPDLYEITEVGTAKKADGKVTDKNGVVTFEYTGAPVKDTDALDVKYTLTTAAQKNYKFDTQTYVTVEDVIVVKEANWNDAVITVEDQISATNTNVTVTLNGNTLTKPTHYTVTPAAVDSTLAKVTVAPVATYFGTDAKEQIFYVNIGKNIATKIASVRLTDTKTTSYTYTGEAVEPAVTVKLNTGATLTEGVDYEIVYENNTNVGTANFYVKGIGDYAGKVTGQSFKITAAKLAETTVEAADVTYEDKLPTVTDLAKALTVKNGDATLTYGKDFTVAISGAVKEGANTLRILPVEDAKYVNFAGSKSVTVNVKKVVDLSAAEIATIANVAYTGAEAKPTLSVKLGDKELVEGTDYTVAYTNNTEVGMATATITGIGSYKGTAARNFVIVPEKVTGLKAIKKTTTTLKLQFNAVKGADGYKIYDAETGKALASVSTQDGASVLKKTIKGLKAGETRKYKVRAYVNVNGTKRYAAYSDIYTKATATK